MSYAAEVLADSPVGFWRLDDVASGSAVDSSGNGHDGTYLNAPSVGAALGGGESASMTTAIDANQTMHVPHGAWADSAILSLEVAVMLTSPTDGGNGDAILSRYYGGTGFDWLLWRNTGGNIAVTFPANAGLSLTGPAMVVGQTYLIAVTADGATAKLYVDGALAASAPCGGVFLSATDIEVGRYSQAGTTCPAGSFADFSMYNTALSAARVAAHHDAFAGAVATSPGGVAAPTATATAQGLTPIVTGASASPEGNVAAPVATATAVGLRATVTAIGDPVAPGQRLDLTPSNVGMAGPVGTWNLPAEIIVTILDPDVDEAPSSITVLVSMAPEGDLAFSIEGEDLWTATADETGIVGPLSLTVPEGLLAGTHELLVTGGAFTGSDQFRIANDPTALPSSDAPDADPVVVESSQGRWVLQDLAEGGLGTWIMHPGPSSAASIPATKNLQATQTTYALGKIHVTEGRTLATEWTFAGYCPDRAFYDKLVAYGALNRRCYVIDPRGRAFLVAFLGPDLVARKRQRDDDGAFNDWAHDYTMRCLFYAEVEL